ncbi:MAG: ThuA domain-containing protein [Flavobacteriaceae bacterium]|nr:ThuA domain-containing protein [Flavobacteriaceae bacterium]
MKLFFRLVFSGLFVLNFLPTAAQENRVLVFNKTEGYHHESIPTGTATIKNLGDLNNFKVTETDDAGQFTENNLKKYQLVIFLSTTGNVLNEAQQKAFENYISKGGNFFGIHAATDTEYDWKWYGDLVGAYFLSHPKIQEANVIVEKPLHPAVAHLPKIWTRTDEWYNLKEISPKINVLLSLDETSYEGGENGENHPIAWYRELEGGGKSIYTGGGHTEESYSEPAFQKHLLQCILFALEGKK